MGRCPTGAYPSSPRRGGKKKGLQTELQTDIIQEIEALLGRQSIRDLDFEAVEMAARRQASRLAAHTREQRLQADIIQEIEALLGRQSIRDLDFEAVEMAARRQALRLAARALEQRLNADTSDHAGAELPCSCGGPAQYHGRHQKTFESVLGPLHLERAYYHCAKCQSGFCPRDH